MIFQKNVNKATETITKYINFCGALMPAKGILGHIKTTKPIYLRRSSTVLFGKRVLLKINVEQA